MKAELTVIPNQPEVGLNLVYGASQTDDPTTVEKWYKYPEKVPVTVDKWWVFIKSLNDPNRIEKRLYDISCDQAKIVCINKYRGLKTNAVVNGCQLSYLALVATPTTNSANCRLTYLRLT